MVSQNVGGVGAVRVPHLKYLVGNKAQSTLCKPWRDMREWRSAPSNLNCFMSWPVNPNPLGKIPYYALNGRPYVPLRWSGCFEHDRIFCPNQESNHSSSLCLRIGMTPVYNPFTAKTLILPILIKRNHFQINQHKNTLMLTFHSYREILKHTDAHCTCYSQMFD